MWYLRTQFSVGWGSAGLMVGCKDLQGLFQCKQFHGSVCWDVLVIIFNTFLKKKSAVFLYRMEQEQILSYVFSFFYFIQASKK